MEKVWWLSLMSLGAVAYLYIFVIVSESQGKMKMKYGLKHQYPKQQSEKVRNLCCLYCLHHDITCVTTILHSFHTYSVCVDLFDSYSVIFLFHIIAVVVMNTLINGKKYKEINRYSFIIILFRLVNNINILSFSGFLFATMFALDDDRMNFDWRMARIGK